MSENSAKTNVWYSVTTKCTPHSLNTQAQIWGRSLNDYPYGPPRNRKSKQL